MFVQVFQGRVHDPDGVRRLLERWQTELAADADGWLGATGGVTSDGELISVVRFDSEEHARRNSDRPEQGAWWEEVAKYFDEQPRFADTTDVEIILGGGRDDAGFVQVIQGRIADRDRFVETSSAFREVSAQDMGRDDYLGGLTAVHGDSFTEVAYFTNEEEARKGEARGAPTEDLRRLFDDWMATLADLRYLDLRDPWLISP